MNLARINDTTREKIADFCQKNHIKKFAFFGSILREDFNIESDVDVLVELEPNSLIGLMGMVGMEMELSEMLGRKVDLCTTKELSKYFRDKVIAEAEVLYERA